MAVQPLLLAQKKRHYIIKKPIHVGKKTIHIVRRKCHYFIPHQILNFYPRTRKLNILFVLLSCYYFTSYRNVIFTKFFISGLPQHKFQSVGPSTQLLTAVILLRWNYGRTKYEDGASVHSFTAILSDKILLCHGSFPFWNYKVDQKTKYPSYVNFPCLHI
jgi:hypothetical protein